MKIKEIITSKYFTVAAFAAAAGLLIFSSVGGAQAAATYYSENYTSRVQMYDIGVSILENGTVVSHRDYIPNSEYVWDQSRGALLSNMIADGEELVFDKEYPEVLTIKNSGQSADSSINTYNRVIVTKYWVDENGEKITSLDPDLIDLNLVNIGAGWILDEEASTSERTILYYSKLLKVGEESVPFADKISISGLLTRKVSQTTGTRTDANGKVYKTLTTTYEYDGATFMIEVEVNAIQEHNAQDAAMSVWGREITTDANGNLALRANAVQEQNITTEAESVNGNENGNETNVVLEGE